MAAEWKEAETCLTNFLIRHRTGAAMTVSKLVRLPILCTALLVILNRHLPTASAQTVNTPPTPTSGTATNPPPIIIKFHALACHGGPVLSVAIGDHAGQCFLADTGTDGTWIDAKAAQQCNLKIEPLIQEGKTVTDYYGQPFKGYNGELTIGNQSMPGFIPIDQGRLRAVFDFADAAERDEGSKVRLNGLVGTNILGEYAVEIDPIRQEMRLYSGAMTDERLNKIGFSGGVASGVELKLDDARGGTPFVTVDVSVTKTEVLGASEGKAQHVAIPMFIDTGSYQTAVTHDLSSLFVKMADAPSASLNGETGDLPVYIYENASLSIGHTTLNHFTCGVIAKDAPASPQNVARLGTDFLAHYHVLIDFPGKRLYLKPVDVKTDYDNPTLHENMTRRVAGLIVEPAADGGWVVKAVASNSRFTHSGMKVGDKIVDVDGTTLSSKSPQAVEFLLTRAGSVYLQRQEKQLHIGITAPPKTEHGR